MTFNPYYETPEPSPEPPGYGFRHYAIARCGVHDFPLDADGRCGVCDDDDAEGEPVDQPAPLGPTPRDAAPFPIAEQLRQRARLLCATCGETRDKHPDNGCKGYVYLFVDSL